MITWFKHFPPEDEVLIIFNAAPPMLSKMEKWNDVKNKQIKRKRKCW